MAFFTAATLEILELGGTAGAIAVSQCGTVKHRVFVADDQEEVLLATAQALEGEFQIVGLAGNGRDVLRLVPKLCPEILILDIVMPVVNGIEVAMRLQAARSAANIVFLTVHEDSDFLKAAMSTGAKGYVSKAHLETDLVPAIRSVLEGGSFVSPSITVLDQATRSCGDLP